MSFESLRVGGQDTVGIMSAPGTFGAELVQIITGAAGFYDLPAITSVGQRLLVYNVTSSNQSVRRAGSDTIDVGTSTGQTIVSLRAAAANRPFIGTFVAKDATTWEGTLSDRLHPFTKFPIGTQLVSTVDGKVSLLQADSTGVVLNFSTDDQLEIKNAGDTQPGNLLAKSMTSLTSGNSPRFAFVPDSDLMAQSSGAAIGWSSGGVDVVKANNDVILERASVGVLQLANGTTSLGFVQHRKTVSIDHTVSPYTAGYGEIIICDTTISGITIALPAISTATKDQQITVLRKEGANNVTVDPDSLESIDGSTSSVIISTSYQPLNILHNGDEWFSGV